MTFYDVKLRHDSTKKQQAIMDPELLAMDESSLYGSMDISKHVGFLMPEANMMEPMENSKPASTNNTNDLESHDPTAFGTRVEGATRSSPA